MVERLTTCRPRGLLLREQIAPLTIISPCDLENLFVFHKPGVTEKSKKGYVSGFSANLPDREGLTLRHFFIQNGLGAEYPVDEMIAFGRLDKDTSGLLLLSQKNKYPKFLDQLLLNPLYKKEGRRTSKVYRAKVKGFVTESDLRRIQNIQIPSKNDELFAVSVESVRLISTEMSSQAASSSWVEIEIYEGKHHQVKKMFYALGHPVRKGGLHRARFAMLTLAESAEFNAADLEVGKIRKLFCQEKDQLVQLYNDWLASEKTDFGLENSDFRKS